MARSPTGPQLLPALLSNDALDREWLRHEALLGSGPHGHATRPSVHDVMTTSQSRRRHVVRFPTATAGAREGLPRSSTTGRLMSKSNVRVNVSSPHRDLPSRPSGGRITPGDSRFRGSAAGSST